MCNKLSVLKWYDAVGCHRPSYVDVFARETFTAVGNLLQTKRMKDFVSNFGCHLTDAVRCVLHIDSAVESKVVILYKVVKHP